MQQPQKSRDNEPGAIAADAQWLPLHFERDSLQFVRLERERHAQVPFLTAQYLGELTPPPTATSVPLTALGNVAADAPAHFIFHSAFCCSTLVARAFDIPGVSMGLKEPQLLNELALALHRRQLDPRLLQLATALLGRPFGRGEAVVIKPSNEANGLAEPILRGNPQSRALLLYAPLPRFLVSVSRKGMWGRIWGRRQFRRLSAGPAPQFGFSPEEQFEQTDLQVAALAWLLHHAQLSSVAALFPGRALFLDSATFLAGKVRSLSALGQHFGLAVDEARWRKIAEGPAFSEDSKRIGKSFDSEADSSAAVSLPLVDEEIEMVTSWAVRVAEHVRIPVDPPREQMLR